METDDGIETFNKIYIFFLFISRPLFMRSRFVNNEWVDDADSINAGQQKQNEKALHDPNPATVSRSKNNMLYRSFRS